MQTPPYSGVPHLCKYYLHGPYEICRLCTRKWEIFELVESFEQCVTLTRNCFCNMSQNDYFQKLAPKWKFFSHPCQKNCPFIILGHDKYCIQIRKHTTLQKLRQSQVYLRTAALHDVLTNSVQKLCGAGVFFDTVFFYKLFFCQI